MYKVNLKAVLVVYVVQLLVAAIWYTAAPSDVASDLESLALEHIKTETLVVFAVALFLYTYFSGWMLVKSHLTSGFDMMLMIIGSWVFVVIPNIIFISMFLDFSHISIGYFLSFGFISCLLAACVLPFWRASRTIFKS